MNVVGPRVARYVVRLCKIAANHSANMDYLARSGARIMIISSPSVTSVRSCARGRVPSHARCLWIRAGCPAARNSIACPGAMAHRRPRALSVRSSAMPPVGSWED